MMACSTTPTLPSVGDYAAAEEALQRGYDALEKVLWALRPVTTDMEGEWGGQPLTLEGVGALYSFVEGLRMQLDQMEETRGELVNALSDLDLRRLTAVRNASRQPAEAS